MNIRTFRIGLVAVPTLAALTGSGWGADLTVVGPSDPSVPMVVQSSPSIVVQPQAPSVVVQPAPSPPSGSTVIVTPGSPQVTTVPTPETVLADSIRAHQVRALTIYANRIKARDVQGVIHQTREMKLGSGKSDIRAPMVTASVIYADEIRADSVVANEIYVRDLSRD